MSNDTKVRSFDLADQGAKKTATAVLGEEDFLSQQAIDDGDIEPEGEAEMREYIGLSVTVRKDTSLDSQLKLAETASGGVSGGDPAKQFQLVRGLVDTMADMIVDWSINSGGEKFEPTSENMRKLPWNLFQAVAKTATKAMSQGRMDPNSARS